MCLAALFGCFKKYKKNHSLPDRFPYIILLIYLLIFVIHYQVMSLSHIIINNTINIDILDSCHLIGCSCHPGYHTIPSCNGPDLVMIQYDLQLHAMYNLIRFPFLK